jgi:uncharacterized membrane protein YcaP (DUF421 family)
MEIVKVTFASLLSVGALFIVAKMMGHKQVAQLDFFDYVSGITFGSIGAELATELESPWKPLIALLIYGFISVGLSVITHKYPRTRKYINGTPTILMNDGKIYRKNLKKSKLDLSEFMLLCREQGYFDLSDIKTAVFEHNGKLSILPNSQNRPITPLDMNIDVEESHIGTEVIMDGRIMGENLLRMGKNEKWLNAQIKTCGYGKAEEIFLGIYYQNNEKLFLYPLE